MMPHNEQTWFAQQLSSQDLFNRLNRIKLIVCDVDGSLTDGHMYITHEHEEGRHFSLLDGFGMVMAMKQGLMISLMSGKEHNSLVIRGSSLNIPSNLCFQKCMEKPLAIQSIMKTYDLKANQVVMFGDDIIDWKVKNAFPDVTLVVPESSPFYIAQAANLVIPRHGGNHAFRLFIDLLLYCQKKHFAQDLINSILLPVARTISDHPE